MGPAALFVLLSLGAVVRVSAMPAEARTQETWYAYEQEMSYDFTARVTPGSVYSRDLLGSDELIRHKLPVEPPAYRRVLVGPLAESLRISLPYRFTADRKGLVRATYQVDGEIRVPNLWRRPYRFLDSRTVTGQLAEFRLEDLTVEIPLRAIISEMELLNEELRLPYDQVEVVIRPLVQIEVEGQREPLSLRLAPEFLVVMRNGATAIELDEPRTVTDAKVYETDARVPLSVDLWGWNVPVATLRRVAYVALGAFALLLVLGLSAKWMQRQRSAAEDLAKLGSGLIRASRFTLPEGVAMVEVARLEQLIQLHMQTERPVVQVGDGCYLIDGSTCYHHSLATPTLQAASGREPNE